MAPPKGHKFSVGNSGGGRHPEYDWDQEFDELVAWAKNNKNELIIRRFAEDKEYSFHSLEAQSQRNPDKFRVRLERAKEIIGSRREQRYLNKYSTSPFEMYSTYYDSNLHEFEREDKKFDSKMKAESQISAMPPNEKNIGDTLTEVSRNVELSKELERMKAKYEPETGTEYLRSEQTPEHMVRGSQIGEDIQ